MPPDRFFIVSRRQKDLQTSKESNFARKMVMRDELQMKESKLEAPLTTVRRWGCEALSNLWSDANRENGQTQTCGNNNCETSEEATAMIQAKTHTRMKSQYDYGDDCDQSTNSTSKH